MSRVPGRLHGLRKPTEGLTPWLKQWSNLDVDEIIRMLTMEWVSVSGRGAIHENRNGPR